MKFLDTRVYCRWKKDAECLLTTRINVTLAVLKTSIAVRSNRTSAEALRNLFSMKLVILRPTDKSSGFTFSFPSSGYPKESTRIVSNFFWSSRTDAKFKRQRTRTREPAGGLRGELRSTLFHGCLRKVFPEQGHRARLNCVTCRSRPAHPGAVR